MNLEVLRHLFKTKTLTRLRQGSPVHWSSLLSDIPGYEHSVNSDKVYYQTQAETESLKMIWKSKMNNLSNQNELTPELIQEYNEEKAKASFQIDTFPAISDWLPDLDRHLLSFNSKTYVRLIKKFCEDETLARRLLISSKRISLSRPSVQQNQKNL